MYLISIRKNIFNRSLEKGFYLSVLLSTLIFSFIVCYFYFSRLYDAKKEQLKQEIHFIKDEIDKTSLAYKEILNSISRRIVAENLINDQGTISSLLKNIYMINKGTGAKIGFLDISWHNASNNVAINRYGAMEASKVFHSNLENNLKTFPNIIHLYAVENNVKLPPAKELYFAMGITNPQGEYIGKLVVLLDIETWINLLRESLDRTADVMVVIDNQQEIFLSTNKHLENSVINAPLRFIGERVNVTYNDYVFLDYIKFSPSPYIILYGYNKEMFYQDLMTIITPVIVILWTLALSFLSALFFLSKKLRFNIRREFIRDIDKLTNEYNKVIEEKANITAELSKECNAYNSTSKYDKGLLEAYRISHREKQNLTLNINSNIANSLIEIREFVKVLIQAQEGVINIPITYDKQIGVLADIHNKLAYVSEFCVVYKEESVDVAAVVCDIIAIYAKDIFLHNLSIIPEISSKIKTIKFNTLLFQQIIVSLLHIAVEYSRPGGEIKIEAIKKKVNNKDNLLFTIKDDGFQVSVDYENELKTNKVNTVSPLQLDLHTIKNIIEAHNGTLEIQYTKEGRIIHFTVPINTFPTKDKEAIIEGGNIVLLKRS